MVTALPLHIGAVGTGVAVGVDGTLVEVGTGVVVGEVNVPARFTVTGPVSAKNPSTAMK